MMRVGDRLYDEYRYTGSSAAPQTVAPLSQLHKVFIRDEPIRLLIDGHNVLFRLDDIFGRTFKNGAPGASARNELIERVARLCANKNNVEVHLHFDGPNGKVRTVSEQVRVTYSGGEGEHRADKAILQDLRFHRGAGSAIPCYLVTDDRGLSGEAEQDGVIVVRADEFAVLLDSR